MPLPGRPRPIPASCSMCNENETCKAFNLLGQPLDLRDVAAGIYAAGMYRVVCQNNTTGAFRDVGGCIDVGGNCADFIPGTVYEDRRIFEDPWWKKFLVPLFAFGAAVSLIATVIIFSNSKK